VNNKETANIGNWWNDICDNFITRK